MEFLKQNRFLAFGLILSLIIHLAFLFFYLSQEERVVSFIPLERLFVKAGLVGGERKKTQSTKSSFAKNALASSEQVSQGATGKEEGQGSSQESSPDGISEAQALGSLEPSYPELSRRKGEEGLCVVKVKISSTGLVEAASLEKSSGFKRLDESALNQVRQTRFTPASQKGVPIASEKQIVFKFEFKK